MNSSLPTDPSTTIDRGLFERTEALDSQILAFLGQGGFGSHDQFEKIAAESFLAQQNPSKVPGFLGVIGNRLSRMEGAPRPLVLFA